MANVNIADVKELRRLTNLGINECKKALEDAEGDLVTALAVLKERGINTALNKVAKQRPMTEGVVEVYQHFTKRMVVVAEVNCETDFVAGTEQFRAFARDVCRWVAAHMPATVEELMSTEVQFAGRSIGTVEQRLLELIAEVGESCQIRRFHVFNLGEDLSASEANHD